MAAVVAEGAAAGVCTSQDGPGLGRSGAAVSFCSWWLTLAVVLAKLASGKSYPASVVYAFLFKLFVTSRGSDSYVTIASISVKIILSFCVLLV
jgi:hypothetical protein